MKPTDRPTLFDATRAPNQTDPSRPDANAISFSITTIRHRSLLGILYIPPRSANRRIGESDDRPTISTLGHDGRYDRHVFRIVRKRHVRGRCKRGILRERDGLRTPCIRSRGARWWRRGGFGRHALAFERIGRFDWTCRFVFG